VIGDRLWPTRPRLVHQSREPIIRAWVPPFPHRRDVHLELSGDLMADNPAAPASAIGETQRASNSSTRPSGKQANWNSPSASRNLRVRRRPIGRQRAILTFA
jgi:hypothetical protein